METKEAAYLLADESRVRGKLVLARTRYGEVAILPGTAVVMLLLVLTAIATSASVPVIFLGLAVWSLRSPKHALEALTLSWLFGYLNHGLVSLSSIASLLRWGVLLAAFMRVFLSYVFTDRPLPKEIIYLGCFSGVVAVLSVLESYAPVVSLLKVATFTIGVVTVLLGFKLATADKDYWASWFATVFVVVLILSILAYLMGVGFQHADFLFQGVLNHPQAFGVFLALFLAWLTGMRLSENHTGMLTIVLLLGYAFAYASRCRTGFAALLLGLGLAIAFGRERRLFLSVLFGRVGRVVIAGLLVVAALITPAVQQAARGFLVKYDKSNLSWSERVESSRGGLIEKSIENFKAQPLTGIGFGVASEPANFHVQSDNALGVPLGAPVEKGFMPSALLEEVGLVGTLFFLLFLFVLARPIIHGNSLAASWMFMTCLAVNIGEMGFFSFGGMGLLEWLLIGFAITLEKGGDALPGASPSLDRTPHGAHDSSLPANDGHSYHCLLSS